MQHGTRTVSEPTTTDRVREHIQRIVRLQQDLEQASADPRDELNIAKREALADGLNMDALNALIPLLTKYSHDKGAKVLNEVIRYAEAFGTEVVLTQTVSAATAPAALTAVAQAPPASEADASAASARRRRSLTATSFRIPAQIVTAVSLTFGLIWLLN